ncbi:uncharacterized protein YALI1_E27976g [Yarrowia lipolytica]|uniref:Uncharacterized protein n=1 Tax=Yarrowia lipolytica TaxID=4952 RepID=A0A1D8NJP3_YARLL|nr:hypothetical protein YALI1_E27976g [Yarrowia lipolytica]
MSPFLRTRDCVESLRCLTELVSFSLPSGQRSPSATYLYHMRCLYRYNTSRAVSVWSARGGRRSRCECWETSIRACSVRVQVLGRWYLRSILQYS